MDGMRMVAGVGGEQGDLRAAKAQPLQSAGRGGCCGVAAPTGMYAHASINREGVKGDDDAARRVATSSEKWENWL